MRDTRRGASDLELVLEVFLDVVDEDLTRRRAVRYS